MKLRTLAFITFATNACGTSSPSEPDAALPDGSADVATGDADAGFPILPYPAGPYGNAIGDTMPDFYVVGYPLSRAQRDYTKVPFRDVSLSEVRSDPSCSCLVVMWNASGWSCPWCVMQDITFSSAMADDPGLCALEVLAFDYDAQNGAPPSRADLDDWVASNRESYAVGLPTPSLYQPLSVGIQQRIPDSFVIRTSDMRFAGVLDGVGATIGPTARALCDTPRPAVETLVSSLAPTALRIDASYAYVLDDIDGLFRVPLSGGAKEILVAASSAPSAFVLDATNVYFTSASAVKQIAKSGGSAITLDSTASAFTDVAADSGFVYATRADGVIERIPLGGGSVETLTTGEVDPGALALDDAMVLFVARKTGEIVAIPKTGGQRFTVAPAGSLQNSGYPVIPSALVMGLGELWVSGYVDPSKESDPNIKVGAVFGLKSGVAPQLVAWGPVATTALAGSGIFLGLSCTAGEFCSGRPQGTIVLTEDAPTNYTTLSPGQPFINAVAGDDSYAYWTVGESAQGAHDGALRRIKR